MPTLARRCLLVPLLSAVTLLLAGCPSRAAGENDRVAASGEDGLTRAPEFPADAQWLNTDHPLQLADLKGKVVLLDFWTYCCINCMHIIPDLGKLEHEFKDELVVVGVHSAKFNNEQQTGNIRNAILRYGIEHPVVNDADMRIWDSYAVHSWPTLVLISPDGRIIDRHSGEGVYDALAPSIRDAVARYDAAGTLSRRSIEFKLERDKQPAAPLSFPGKIEVDRAGKRIFVSDSGHNRIVVLSVDGKVLDVIGDGGPFLTDGGFSNAQFSRPQGLAYEAKNDVLYVADTENHAVRRVDLKSKQVSTLAGTGHQASSVPDPARPGYEVDLTSPWDLLEHAGKLYVAMAGIHQLWTIDTQTWSVSVFAGTGGENIMDAPLTRALLAQTSGVATDGQQLYFVDSETSSIRSAGFAPDSSVKTLIGEGLFEFGDVDGKYPYARLQHPLGIDFHDGGLYIADTYNHKVRKYDLKTGELTTFVGTGNPGSANGPRLEASLNEPGDVAVLDGKLYIADTNNSVIRVCDLATDEVSTLELKGVEKLMQTPQLQPPTNASTAAPGPPSDAQRLPDMEMMAGPWEIEFELELPKGSKFNLEAPTQLHASSDDAELLSTGDARFDPTSMSFKVPVTANKPGEVYLTYEVAVFFCDSASGQCYTDQRKLVQKVSIHAKGGATVPWVHYRVEPI